jgi:hypothetical protein
MRAQHQVRPLQSEEEGSAIGHLPGGVYGYAYALGHEQTPVFAQKTYHSFEMHKAPDGTEYVLGFVTLEEARDLDEGKEGVGITLFPDPWEASEQLVSVPVSRIVAPKRVPPREPGNPFPFTLR